MEYTPFEIRDMLENMVVLYDTREQDTPALHKRLEGLGCPYERKKLDFGDYTCQTLRPDGSMLTMADKVAVERKMNLDELCQCFGKGRGRFEREFERARNAGAKLYLLIENGSIDQAMAGNYRSLMHPDALTASLFAWQPRYDCRVHFCKPENTGAVIYKILRYELKEYLEEGKDSEYGGEN